MSDREVLEIGLLKNGNIKNIAVTEKYLNKHPDFALYLKNRYNDIPEEMFSYREVIWRIKHNIKERPKCKSCGKPVSFVGKESWERAGKTKNGYLIFCCPKCSNNDEEVKNKVKKTTIKKYGKKREIVRKKFEKTMLLKYGVKNALENKEILKKATNTLIEHYGVTSPAKNEEIKRKIIETNFKRYGNVAPACSEFVIKKIRQTVKERYGADSFFESDKYKELRKNNEKIWTERAINSAIKNGTRYSSVPEKKMYELLCVIFGADDIIRQYKSDKYPFLCDFYLKEEDIYIEYNGTYFHGNCLYNEARDRDKFLKYIEKCTEEHPSYKRIFDVWVNGDVKKYNTAKDNKLNFIFFYKFWDEDWVKFTNGRIAYCEENIIKHLKQIVKEQTINKGVRIIGEKYD